MGLRYVDTDKVLDSVTSSVANTDAPAIEVGARQLKSIQFVAVDTDRGSGAFGIEISNDGDNWVVYNRLITNGTVADQHSEALVAAPTITSDGGSAFYFFSQDDHFKYIRFFITITGAGTYSAIFHRAG
jgi:hypothetical protein